MKEEQKGRSQSVFTPTDKELRWWLARSLTGKLLKLALLAGAIYAAWRWVST